MCTLRTKPRTTRNAVWYNILGIGILLRLMKHSYIGKTGRTLSIRVREHTSQSQGPTAVGKIHKYEKTQDGRWRSESTQVTESNTWWRRKIRGAVEIRTHQPKMSRDIGGWMNQAYCRLSTTHGSYHWLQVAFGGVCRCMRGDLMWTCLVWAERSTPNSFWVPSHRFNSAKGEQKGITQTIYTDSEPPSRMPNSLMPSAKLRSANLPFFRSLVWRGRESNPGLLLPKRTL